VSDAPDGAGPTANGGTRFVLRVTDPDTMPDGPAADVRFRRELHLVDALGRLLRSRAVIAGLIVRQIRSQYSQQFLGIAWAIITPFAQTLLFTVLLNRAGTRSGIDTGGVPKPLFLYASLLAWAFFASAVQSGGSSLVGNPLLNKVYAPREVFPLSQIASSAVNSAAGLLVLPILFALHQHGPTATLVWTPIFLLLLLGVTTAFTLMISATTVYLRDLRSGLPLLIQLGMFSPGVLYPVDKVIDGPWRLVYTALLPIGSIIEQIRATFLLGQAPDVGVSLTAAGAVGAYLLVAFVFFKRLETGFADVS
jgi:ABC-2 type transport system permease protein/lipopolysaccharide transport system permease protein